MNIYKRLFAVTASAALMLSGVSGMPVSAELRNYEGEPIDSEENSYVPDWVPKNYIEALYFVNQHGATYAEGDYVCVVQERSKAKDSYYDIRFSGKSVDKHELSFYYNQEFYLEDMEIPEDTDEKLYLNFMDEYGRDNDEVQADNYFKVIVFSPLFFDVDVTFESGSYEDNEPVVTSSTTYTFGYTTSTIVKEEFDVFRFLPDCIDEYDAFRRKFGTVSIYDDYVIYCDDVLFSAGSDLEVQNSAPDKLKEIMSYTIKGHYPSTSYIPAGGADHVVKVYKPQAAGDVSLTFTKKTSAPVRDYDEVLIKDFTISEIEDYDGEPNLRINENVADLPDWVPTNVEDALEFERKYGATRIVDNYVCMVRNGGDSIEHIREWNYKKEEDTNSQIYKKYFERMEEGTEWPDLRYIVEVFKLEPSTVLDVTWNKSLIVTKNGDRHTYSFNCDENGVVTESDLFGYLPDCISELYEYIEKNGDVSTHGRDIVYCNKLISGVGYGIDAECIGTAKLDRYVDYFIQDPEGKMIEKSDAVYVAVYRAEKPGKAKMAFTLQRSQEKDEKAFSFDLDLNAEAIDISEFPAAIIGDCNYDGVVGLSDYVMLKKYLQTGKGLESSRNADINHDNRVNVFDFIELKKILLNGNTTVKPLEAGTKPILAAVYNNNAWGLQQEVTVYDENGISYTMSLDGGRSYYPDATYSEKLVMATDNDWYGRLTDIIKNEKAIKGSMPDNLISKTNELSKNIAEYSKITTGKSMGARWDGGTTTYYLIGEDKDGKHIFMNICSDGDMISITDCEEIKEYIRYGSYEEFFMNPSGYSIVDVLGTSY